MANRPRSTMPTSTASRVFTTLKHLDWRTCLRSRPSLFWNGRKSFRFPRPGRWFGFDWSTWEAILAGFPCRIPSDYLRRAPVRSLSGYACTRDCLPGPGTAVRLGGALWPKHMPSEPTILKSSETQGIELKSYNVSIPMGTLAIGVDNIHHDVFLSPKFVQAARDYLLDLIRQHTSSAHSLGMEPRPTRGPDNAAFRKILTDLLQSSLTQAKFHKNIEIDLLFRLSLLKFLASEIGNQFANIILEGKEWIRQRGEHFERSQQAHVIKARLSELQASRRQVVRRVGQQVAQILVDVEENTIAKTRRALFGEDFAPYYELCKNRLIFLDGGKDDVFFLEHYVLLGNYARDPDRFEAMDVLFQEFLREAGVTFSPEPAFQEADKAS